MSNYTVVYDGPPATPEWFAVRREGITGTDLPQILGLTRYGNALRVWRDKFGELDDSEEMEAATWGHIFEEPVAAEWARRNKTAAFRVGVIANSKDDWIRASLDRVLFKCPDAATYDPQLTTPTCGLEVKTRNQHKLREFAEGIPDNVLAQVQWGLMATDFPHMHVAVLIGGQKLLSFRVDRDQVLEDYLRQAASDVWEAVLDNEPPPVHPDAEGVLLNELNDLFRERKGDVELPATAATYLKRYRAAGRRETEAKGSKTKAKTALVQMLGSGSTGLLDGRIAFTYKTPDPTDQITSEDLAKLKLMHPRIYTRLKRGNFITQTSPGPRINVKRKVL